MHSKFLVALGLAASLSTPVFAQSMPEKDPAKIQAGSYNVEPHHTQILFGVSHFGLSTFYGQFTASSGTLDFNPADPAKSALDITIQTASVATENAKLDGELKGADWFDADKYPTAEFKSTAVQPTGADTGDVTGTLTLHGVTKPVTLHVVFNGGAANPISKKYTVGFQASGTIKRSEFGITQYLPGIGDEVALTISGAFERS